MPWNLLGRNPDDHCRDEIGWSAARPTETSTTKPGNSAVSEHKQKSSHDQILGQPLMLEPVFMNSCAGSLLICSVCIERTTQMSSATEAMCGKRSETSVPYLPYFLKLTNGPRARRTVFWSWASCWPLVN